MIRQLWAKRRQLSSQQQRCGVAYNMNIRGNVRSTAPFSTSTESVASKSSEEASSVSDSQHFDVVILGSGPAALACAKDSAKRNKRVAIVEANADRWGVGGVSVHTGTLPSKTFRESSLFLSNYRHSKFDGASSVITRARSANASDVEEGDDFVSHNAITSGDILGRVNKVVDQQEAEIMSKLLSYGNISIFDGVGTFQDPHTVAVKHKKRTNVDKESDIQSELRTEDHDEEELRLLTAEKFLIATGTYPAHTPLAEFDGCLVMDSDQFLQPRISESHAIPKHLIVVGAGVVGMEYASMMNILPGTKVTVIDARDRVLGFCDKEIVNSLINEMRHKGARFLLGECLEKIEKDEEKGTVTVTLQSGKRVEADGLLYSVGRQGNTAKLNLENALEGVEPNKRGLIDVNPQTYQLPQYPHIFAAGDCIGPPQLAATSWEQGRLVSTNMWHDSCPSSLGTEMPSACESQLQTGTYPIGIYTVPEISMVGKTEDDLTNEKVDYEVGVARFEELAKTQMSDGGLSGELKILFERNTLEILGCHAVGQGATEIIHIGQVAMHFGCTLPYFVNTVFNYPTLAEAYRVAGLNGLGKVDRHE